MSHVPMGVPVPPTLTTDGQHVVKEGSESGGRTIVFVPGVDVYKTLVNNRVTRERALREAVDPLPMWLNTLDYARSGTNPILMPQKKEGGRAQAPGGSAARQLPPVSASITPRRAHWIKHKLKSKYPPRPVNCANYMPGGKYILTANDNGMARMYAADTFQLESEVQIRMNEAPVFVMKWSHDARWLLVGDGKGYVQYVSPTLKPILERQCSVGVSEGNAVRAAAWAPGSRKFVTAGDNSLASVWDFARATPEFDFREHGQRITCCDWNPSSSLIISGGYDSRVLIWDARSTKVVDTANFNTSVRQLSWSPADHNLFAVGSMDGMVSVFDVRSVERPLRSYRSIHANQVTCVAWHPKDPRVLATAGNQGEIVFWDINSDKPHTTLMEAHQGTQKDPKGRNKFHQQVKSGGIWDLSWHPNGHSMLSASADHTVRVWGRTLPGHLGWDTRGKSLDYRYRTDLMAFYKKEDAGEAELRPYGTKIDLPGLGDEYALPHPGMEEEEVVMAPVGLPAPPPISNRFAPASKRIPDSGF